MKYYAVICSCKYGATRSNCGRKSLPLPNNDCIVNRKKDWTLFDSVRTWIELDCSLKQTEG